MKQNNKKEEGQEQENSNDSTIIYGKNSIQEALEKDYTITKVWINKDSNDPKLRKLEQDARAKKIPVIKADKNKLRDIAETDDHRSIVAQISPVNLYGEDFLYTDQIQKIILPVNVQDPHNVGAIIRSAQAFGFDAITISNRNSAQVNQTVINSSAGAALSMPIVRIGNISQCIEKLKKKGFWIYGADASAESEDLNKIKFDRKTVLLVGNEGEGLPQNIQKNCDFVVRIPMQFESLNVSVATGIIMQKIYSDSQEGE